MQPKVKGRLDLSPKDAIYTIIEVALKEEKKIETEEDTAILEHLLTTVEKEGLAVKGINEVLRSIPLGACQVLVVDEEYRVPGYVCEDCAYLAVEEGLCSFCKKRLFP